MKKSSAGTGVMMSRGIERHIAVRVDEKTHRALRVRAAEEGRTLAAILRALVGEYLTGNGP